MPVYKTQISDTAYGVGWNGVTTLGASKNAIYDKIETLGSGGAEATTKSITQASHGFAVGDVLKYSGSTYAKAQANTAANAEVVGIVSAVADVNTFTLLTEGYISTLSGLTANTTYFLSDSSAGALTSTEPSTVGYISKPLLRAVSTTAGVFNNMRGVAIVAASGGSATSLLPRPQSYQTGTSTATHTFLNDTTAIWGSFIVPVPITVNKLTIRAGTVSSATTLDIAIYSDGAAAKVIDITTASINSSNTNFSTSVSAVVLPAGRYYIAIIANSASANAAIFTWDTDSNTDYLGNGVTSEPIYIGTSTETAGTLPSSKDTTAIN